MIESFFAKNSVVAGTQWRGPSIDYCDRIAVLAVDAYKVVLYRHSRIEFSLNQERTLIGLITHSNLNYMGHLIKLPLLQAS